MIALINVLLLLSGVIMLNNIVKNKVYSKKLFKLVINIVASVYLQWK